MSQQAFDVASGQGRDAGEISEWIVAQVAQALKVDNGAVDITASLDSLGLDSVTAFTLTGELAGWLNRELPATLLWDYPSIEAIADGLAEPGTEATGGRGGVVTWQSAGLELPLFFFPGQGGHPVTFASLASHLGKDRPCYGLTVPGLQGEQAPAESVEEIARSMVERLQKIQKRGPYQLVGYSFGGLLAYEAAVQLTTAGEQVSLLAIYDTFTRAGRRVRPWWQRVGVHAFMLTMQPGRWAYLTERIKRRTIAPPEDAVSIAEMCEHAATASAVERANIAALERYEPRPYSGTAIVFRAAERSDYEHFYKSEASCGWGALVKGGVQTIVLPGNHLSILDAHHAPGAAAQLRPSLNVSA